MSERPKQEPPENDDEAVARALAQSDEQMAADMQLALDLAAQDEEDDAFRNAVDEHAAAAPGELLDSGLVGGRVIGHVQRRKSDSAAAPKSNKTAPSISVFGPGKPTHSLAAAMDDGSKNMDENSSLLYVPCEIKGRVVEMMVDSGSQTSVMSSAMMKTLNLEKRLNDRFIGVCAGIGETRIIGRIENCPVQMGHVEFRLYFLVLDSPHNMMIFGIDQMRRFKCLIDLENDVLIFGGRGGVEVPFLPPDPQQKNARTKECTIC